MRIYVKLKPRHALKGDDEARSRMGVGWHPLSSRLASLLSWTEQERTQHVTV